MNDGIDDTYDLDPVPVDETPDDDYREQIREQDPVAFLQRLEQETHTATETSTLKDYSRVEYVRHEYRRDLTPEEADHLFETVEDEDLIVYPSIDFPETGNPGVGGRAYAVVDGQRPAPGVDPELEPVIRFKAHQLPDGYDRDDVHALMDRDRNHELLSVYDLPDLGPDDSYPALVDWTELSP